MGSGSKWVPEVSGFFPNSHARLVTRARPSTFHGRPPTRHHQTSPPHDAPYRQAPCDRLQSAPAPTRRCGATHRHTPLHASLWLSEARSPAACTPDEQTRWLTCRSRILRASVQEAWNDDGSPKLYDHSAQHAHAPGGARVARARAAASLLGFSSGAFYHWVMEALPRLALLLPALHAQPALKLVVPKHKADGFVGSAALPPRPPLAPPRRPLPPHPFTDPLSRSARSELAGPPEQRPLCCCLLSQTAAPPGAASGVARPLAPHPVRRGVMPTRGSNGGRAG